MSRPVLPGVADGRRAGPRCSWAECSKCSSSQPYMIDNLCSDPRGGAIRHRNGPSALSITCCELSGQRPPQRGCGERRKPRRTRHDDRSNVLACPMRTSDGPLGGSTDARLAQSLPGELARHQDLGTTQRYMHLSPAAIRSAIDLLEQPAPSASRGDIMEAAIVRSVN
jgi:hypothetical protein